MYKVVARLNNHCFRENATTCFVCIVDLHVLLTVKNPLNSGNAKMAPLYPVFSNVIFFILSTSSRGFFMDYSHVTVNHSLSRTVTVTAPNM
jgi:hypothetical protein